MCEIRDFTELISNFIFKNLDMKYALFIRDFGESKFLDIEDIEFNSIQNAKQILNFISQYEETYDILISNYFEFEKEILILAAENMIYRHDEDFFYEIRMQLNKRLINILTVIRLYQDSISSLIPQPIANRNSIIREFKGFFSNEFDNSKYYRFMEALRNYVQHKGLPINITSLNHQRRDFNNKSFFENGLEFSVKKERLISDKLFKIKILQEIENEVNLKLYVRNYIESVSNVHVKMRSILCDSVDKSRIIFENAHKNFSNKYSIPTDYLEAISYEDESIINKISLTLRHDNIRIQLQKRNNKLINLGKQYISGITEKQ